MGSKFTTIDPGEHDRIDERLKEVKRTAAGQRGRTLEDEINGLLFSMYPPEPEMLGQMAGRLEEAAKKLRELQSDLEND